MALVWLSIILTYLVHSTLIFGAARVFVLVQRPSPRAEERIWRLVLFGGVASTIAALLSPLNAMVWRIDDATQPETFTTDLTSSLNSAHAPFVATHWPSMLMAMWLAVVVFKLARLALALRALRHVALRTLSLHEHKQVIAAVPDIEHRATVCIVDRDVSPYALLNKVVLPSRALAELSRSALRAVLRHELAHIERRDSEWQIGMAIASCVLFVQPMLRFVAARCRTLSEVLCDDAAARGVRRDRLALAKAVVQVAAWQRGDHGVAASAFAGSSRESLMVWRVARLTTAAPKRSAARSSTLGKALTYCTLALAIVAWSVVPALMLQRERAQTTVVSASDPAGPFSLTLHRGRVVAASLEGVPLASQQIIQHGPRVTLAAANRQGVDLELSGPRSIRWTPRPPR